VYQLWVILLIVTIASSWGFVWFCHFPLLLELAEVLNLIFAEFCESIIKLKHCFMPLSNQMIVQRLYT
jgi:hypothetical protein